LIELYFGDETGITLQPYIPYGWQKKGHQIQILCRTKSKRLNLFGLMSLDNQLSVYHQESSLTGEFIVESLTDFVGKAHTKPVVIVLDNGPIHRCEAVYEQQAKWEDQDMYLFFLPTYSPHLNPIEILWRFIKYRWLQKIHYGSWGRLKKAIFAIIRTFGQEYSICFNQLISKNKMQFNSA
jgi:transposase